MAALPIRVLRGVADFTGGGIAGPVLVMLGTTVDLTRAFVRVTGTMHGSGGIIGGQAAATTVRDFSVRCILGPDVVRVIRPGSDVTGEIRVYFEVWEFTGQPGDDHEFQVVAGPLQTPIADGQFQAVVGLDLAEGVNVSRCIPILMAQMGATDTATVQDLHCTISRTSQIIFEGSPDGTVIIDRGGTTGITTVSWVLVEFNGPAWTVSDTIVVTPGASYSFDGPQVWENTLLFSSYLNASTGTGPSSYALYPATGSTTALTLYQQQAPTTASDHRAVVYALQSLALEVFHSNWDVESDLLLTVGTSGTPQTVSRTGAQVGFRDMVTDRTGMIATATVGGATAECPRQHVAYRITGTDSIDFFRGYAGGSGSLLVAIQLAYFAPEAPAVSEAVEFADTWTSTEELNVFFSDLGRIVEFASASTGDFAAGTFPVQEVLRFVDSWTVQTGAGVEEPPPPESDIDFLRANWNVRVVIDTAEVTDVTRAGDSATEERVTLLDRPRRTVSAQLTGPNDRKSAEFRLNITRATQGNFDLPLWSDMAELTSASSGTTIWCDTAHRRFVIGGRVIIHTWGADGWPTGSQIRTIDAILPDRLTVSVALDGSFPITGRCYPLVRCRPALDVPVVALTDGAIQVDFEARELEGTSTLPPRELPTTAQTYRGWPVVSTSPNWVESPSVGLGRRVEQENVGVSTFDRFLSDDTAADHEMLFTFPTRARAWHDLSIFESRRGRAQPMWILGPQSAGKVTAITTSSVTIDGESDVSNVAKAYRFVAVQVRGQDPQIVKLAQAYESNTGGVILDFEEDLSSLPNVSEVLRVTSAHLVRMSADVFREEWITTEVCEASITVADTLGEPIEVAVQGFAEAVSSSTGTIEAIPDLWCYMDSTRNALRATTITDANFANQANGELVEPELWPREDSDVHFWADVRWEPGATAAYRYIASQTSLIADPVMRKLRTIGDGTAPTATTGGTNLGSPSIVRIGSIFHRLILGETTDGSFSAAPWGAEGFTLFLHLNTPVASLEPTAGSLDVISWLADSGGAATWFVAQIGRTRMILNQVAQEIGTPGWNIIYPDLFNGTKKLIAWHVEFGGSQTLYVDGAVWAQTGAPPELAAITPSSTRLLRWFGGSPLASVTTGPSLKVGDQLQANALAIVSRPVTVAELNAMGTALAARHGTAWAEVS